MLALNKITLLSISKKKVIINRKSLQKLQKQFFDKSSVLKTDRNSKRIRPTLVKRGTFLTI